MHQPYADLIMIAGIKGSPRTLDTVKEVLWLLGSSRFGESLAGGLELIGRVRPLPRAMPTFASRAASTTATAGATADATAAPMCQENGAKETAAEQEQGVLHGVQRLVSWSPRRGVVLSLPRRALQGWLLTEGRARNKGGGGGGGGGGGLWKPSWVEDGIDVVAPVLPGLHTADSLRGDGGCEGVGIGAGGGDGGNGSKRAPVDDAGGAFSPFSSSSSSSLQEA